VPSGKIGATATPATNFLTQKTWSIVGWVCLEKSRGDPYRRRFSYYLIVYFPIFPFSFAHWLSCRAIKSQISSENNLEEPFFLLPNSQEEYSFGAK
jgi:hypothetical protein